MPAYFFEEASLAASAGDEHKLEQLSRQIASSSSQNRERFLIEKDDMAEYEISMVFSNRRETTVKFVLEPWGEIYPIEPRASLTVSFRSSILPSSPHNIEIEYGVDAITVYAWEGSTVALFQDGEEVGPGAFSRLHVPEGLEVLKKIGFFRGTMDEAFAQEGQQEDE